MVENSGVAVYPRPFCENCGSAGDIKYRKLRDRLFNAPGEWDYRQCSQCGLGWIDPQPLPGEVRKFYESYYTHAAATDASYESHGIKRLTKRLLAVAFFWRREQFQTDYLNLEGLTPGRLLEIGCGSGGFLSAAKRVGWDVTGLDFDQAAVEQAKARGVDACAGELRCQGYPAELFDAVVMNNTIEHVWNPREIVNECCRILKKGGRLVAITPNMESRGHQIFAEHWRGLETPRHLFIFSARSLGQIATLAGFSRVFTYTSSGGEAGSYILGTSKKLAADGGNPNPAVDVHRVLRSETIGSMFGKHEGEWVVLVATK